jgi:hypothetical protein
VVTNKARGGKSMFILLLTTPPSSSCCSPPPASSLLSSSSSSGHACEAQPPGCCGWMAGVLQVREELEGSSLPPSVSCRSPTICPSSLRFLVGALAGIGALNNVLDQQCGGVGVPLGPP